MDRKGGHLENEVGLHKISRPTQSEQSWNLLISFTLPYPVATIMVETGQAVQTTNDHTKKKATAYFAKESLPGTRS